MEHPYTFYQVSALQMFHFHKFGQLNIITHLAHFNNSSKYTQQNSRIAVFSSTSRRKTEITQYNFSISIDYSKLGNQSLLTFTNSAMPTNYKWSCFINFAKLVNYNHCIFTNFAKFLTKSAR